MASFGKGPRKGQAPDHLSRDEFRQRQRDREQPARVLVICASDRNDGTCPGEMSKSFRLVGAVSKGLEQEAVGVIDTLV